MTRQFESDAVAHDGCSATMDVAIIGGGLAGLALARQLHGAGVTFKLFEARSRLGGRIAVLDAPAGRVDLGPSWFWPGQPRIAGLIAELGLRAFPQHTSGDSCMEDAQGRVQRGRGFASMEGAFRVEGGMMRLIEGLAAQLPDADLHLECPVASVIRGSGVVLADGRHCAARHVVLALPPRVATGLLFDPVLPLEVLHSLGAIATWMAGHAKFVAVYDRPFWREAGFSGDAVSGRGPMAEIHDASGSDGAPAALFGFLGLPAQRRNGRASEITLAALEQLSRLFGPAAMHPVTTSLKDWAFDPETATATDQTPPRGHPAYSLPVALSDLWDGGLHVAATETAPEMGGLMEGALASAARVGDLILEMCGQNQ